MKARNPLLCIFPLIIVLCSPLAFAEDVDLVSGASTPHSSDSMKYRYGESGDAMLQWGDELGLTGQQRTDIQIIMADYMPRYRDLAKLGRETASSLMRMSPDDPAYVEQTQKASATAASSAAELVTLLSEMRGKLYAVLTEAQRQKLHEMIESGHHRAHEENPEP